MYCTALHYTLRHCTAVQCREACTPRSALQTDVWKKRFIFRCTAKHVTTLQFTAQHREIVFSVACQRSAVQYTPSQYCRLRLQKTVLYCTALHCAVVDCSVHYCTALYFTELHCTALYCTALQCPGGCSYYLAELMTSGLSRLQGTMGESRVLWGSPGNYG